MTSAGAPASSDPRLLRLAPEDNVCAVTTTLEAGEVVQFEGRPLRVRGRIPTGHKMAVEPIGPGELVRKYGLPIGSASQQIEPGDYVHLHNLRSNYLPTYTLGKTASKGGKFP